MAKNRKGLEPKKVLSLLKKGGPIYETLPDFELRPQQEEMLQDVIEAYNLEKITFIEAGTGTGKSLAYLLPSLLVALHFQQRVLISTNTIALQEQLIQKDIPFLINALNLEIQAELAKGMGNYLCLRKLEETHEELNFVKTEEKSQLVEISHWSKKTRDGTRSDLPFVPLYTVWEQVACESDACSHKKCPFYDKCFFFKARKRCESAQVIVVNHHLLFSDIVYRAQSENYKDVAILPAYQHVIIDEAHHIEAVALDHYATDVSRWSLWRLLNRLDGDGRSLKRGKLEGLEKKLLFLKVEKNDNEIDSIFKRLRIDIPGHRRELQDSLQETFDYLEGVCQEFIHQTKESEKKDEQESYFRLRKEHFEHMLWKEEIVPRLRHLSRLLASHIQMIKALMNDIKLLPYEELPKSLEGVCLDIDSLLGRINLHSEILKKFITFDEEASLVYWCEWMRQRSRINFRLVIARLDIAELLKDQFFNRFSTIVMTSATLATNQDFSFIRGRLGVDHSSAGEEQVTERIYSSPFDFNKQSLLAVPSDIPMPHEPQFTEVFSEYLPRLMSASRGNAFVLFTSYGMLKKVFDQTKEKLESMGLYARRQGEENRQALLTWFRETEGAILFGTDSFWEGVDVVGDALRCVVLAKLPFKVPTEPLVQAQTEALLEDGKDPFIDYSVPQAIMKFKQGFGRLIRNRKDRGCIVCMDRRLKIKAYGRLFLNSLPSSTWMYEAKDSILEKMESFYSFDKNKTSKLKK